MKLLLFLNAAALVAVLKPPSESRFLRSFKPYISSIKSALNGVPQVHIVNPGSHRCNDLADSFLHEGENASTAAAVVLTGDEGNPPSGNAFSESLVYFLNENTDINGGLNFLERKWDVKGRVVFVICTAPDDLRWIDGALASIWSHKITNFAVVFHHRKIAVLTYNPFFGKRRRSSGLKIDNFFPDKFANLNGFKVSVGVYSNPTFADVKNGSYSGTDIILLKVIMDVMNADLNIVEKKGGDNSTDFTFYSSVITAKQSKTFPLLCVYPYVMDNVVLIVPKSRRLPQYQYLMLVFDAIVWGVIFSSMVLIVALSIVINIILNDDCASTTDLCFYTVEVFLSVPIRLKKKLKELRMIFLLWAFLCLAVTSAFSCELISVLINPKYHKEINTVAEVLGSDLDIMLTFHFADLLSEETKSHGSTDDIVIASKSDILESISKKVTRYAYILPQSSVNHIVLPHENGGPVYHVAKQFLLPTIRSFWCIGGYVYLRKIEEIILRLYENGIVSYIESNYKRTYMTQPKEFVKLKLSHLQFAFFVLGAGYVCSTLVVIVENIFLMRARI